MAGLVPAIHVFHFSEQLCPGFKDVDARQQASEATPFSERLWPA
jgi:hypothetical protein